MVSFTEYVKNKELNEEETFDELISEFGTAFKTKAKSKEMASRLLSAASKTPDGKERLEVISAKAKEGSLSASDIKDPTTKNLALALEVIATGAKPKDLAILKSAGIEPEAEKTISKSAVLKNLKAVNKPSIKAIKPAEVKAETPVEAPKTETPKAKTETPKVEPETETDEVPKAEPEPETETDEVPDETPDASKEAHAKKTKDLIARSAETRKKVATGEKAPNPDDPKDPASFKAKAEAARDAKVEELTKVIDNSPENKKVKMTAVVDKMVKDINKKIAAIQKQQSNYSYKSNFKSKLNATGVSDRLLNDVNLIIKTASGKSFKKGLDTGLETAGKGIAGAVKGIKKGAKTMMNTKAVTGMRAAAGKVADTTARVAKRTAEVAAPAVKRTTAKIADKVKTETSDAIIRKWNPDEFEKYVNSTEATEKAAILDKAKKARDFAREEADKKRRLAKGKQRPITKVPDGVMTPKAKEVAQKIAAKTA